MAKIKNVSGDDRLVPWLNGRLVLAGAVVDVPDEDTYAFTCQTTIWEPADKAATKAHEAADKAENPVHDDTPTEG